MLLFLLYTIIYIVAFRSGVSLWWGMWCGLSCFSLLSDTPRAFSCYLAMGGCQWRLGLWLLWWLCLGFPLVRGVELGTIHPVIVSLHLPPGLLGFLSFPPSVVLLWHLPFLAMSLMHSSQLGSLLHCRSCGWLGSLHAPLMCVENLDGWAPSWPWNALHAAQALWSGV